MKNPLAGALVSLALCAPAYAQHTLTAAESEEAFCVLNKADAIEDDATVEAIALLNVEDELPEAIGKIAAAALDPIVAACKAQYNWSEEISGHATNVAVLALSIDWLSTQSQVARAPATLTKDYAAIVGGLSREEANSLMLGQWKADPALREKMRTLLVSYGVPNDPPVIDLTTRLVSALQAYAVEGQRFVAMRFPG